MLQFLLDEQISPDVATGLRRHVKGVHVHALAEWGNGQLLGVPDEVMLIEAHANGLTVVTYDRKTIPPLLKRWAEENTEHSGVIFVDDKTIPSSDFGGLVRALTTVFKEADKWDWTNRIYALRRQ